MNKDVNIKLRIDQATHDKLKERAELHERTVAAEIRLALRAYLAPVKGAA
jgi:plasmid stability protein